MFPLALTKALTAPSKHPSLHENQTSALGCGLRFRKRCTICIVHLKGDFLPKVLLEEELCLVWRDTGAPIECLVERCNILGNIRPSLLDSLQLFSSYSFEISWAESGEQGLSQLNPLQGIAIFIK